MRWHKRMTALCLAASLGTALAQTTTPPTDSGSNVPLQTFQGMIFGADANAIIIRTFDGRYATLVVSGPMTLTRTTTGTLSGVQAGSKAIAASQVDKSGNITSQEIVIAPATDPPQGAPSPIWLDQPATKLDAGLVQSARAPSGTGGTSTDGSLQLAQGATAKSVAVSAKARVRIIAYAGLADLQRNTRVRAIAARNSNGALTAKLVDIVQQ